MVGLWGLTMPSRLSRYTTSRGSAMCLFSCRAELGEAALRCSISSGRRSLPSSRAFPRFESYATFGRSSFWTCRCRFYPAGVNVTAR
jgi:hypothetical protein